MNLYGLKADPFSTTPDPQFAYQTREHQLAMLKIQYSVEQRQGLFLLQGQVGTGKTTLCRFLQDALGQRDRFRVAYLPAMDMATAPQFLRAVNEALGLPASRFKQENDKTLLSHLLEEHKAGRAVVLMIDEAQTIHGRNLNTLHMLSNLQTTKHKLLQIVLFSQPNFARKLDQAPALRSRITGAAFLDPLSFEDAIDMLRFRVEKAGGDFDRLFPGEELHHGIYQTAGGVPRELCVLCNAALIDAAARRLPHVTRESLDSAIRDFQFKFKPGNGPGPAVGRKESK